MNYPDGCIHFKYLYQKLVVAILVSISCNLLLLCSHTFSWVVHHVMKFVQTP